MQFELQQKKIEQQGQLEKQQQLLELNEQLRKLNPQSVMPIIGQSILQQDQSMSDLQRLRDQKQKEMDDRQQQMQIQIQQQQQEDSTTIKTISDFASIRSKFRSESTRSNRITTAANCFGYAH